MSSDIPDEAVRRLWRQAHEAEMDAEARLRKLEIELGVTRQAYDIELARRKELEEGIRQHRAVFLERLGHTNHQMLAFAYPNDKTLWALLAKEADRED